MPLITLAVLQQSRTSTPTYPSVDIKPWRMPCLTTAIVLQTRTIPTSTTSDEPRESQLSGNRRACSRSQFFQSERRAFCAEARRKLCCSRVGKQARFTARWSLKILVIKMQRDDAYGFCYACWLARGDVWCMYMYFCSTFSRCVRLIFWCLFFSFSCILFM